MPCRGLNSISLIIIHVLITVYGNFVLLDQVFFLMDVFICLSCALFSLPISYSTKKKLD